jgi:hypothetical protein
LRRRAGRHIKAAIGRWLLLMVGVGRAVKAEGIIRHCGEAGFFALCIIISKGVI